MTLTDQLLKTAIVVIKHGVERDLFKDDFLGKEAERVLKMYSLYTVAKTPVDDDPVFERDAKQAKGIFGVDL